MNLYAVVGFWGMKEVKLPDNVVDSTDFNRLWYRYFNILRDFKGF